jgi:serine/threonine-protein kinase HipA
MAYEPAAVIEVRAWGKTVGAVIPGGARGSYLFEYDQDWIAGGVELAPLQMPLRAGPESFPNLNRDTWLGLPPLLADSLPDKFGNQLVNAWMARRGVDPASVTALDRLAYTGDRGMGALTFHDPLLDRLSDPSAIAMGDLVTAARAQLVGNIDDGDDVAVSALRQLIDVGSSAGGARAKAVVAYNQTTGQLRSGQLPAPDGFSHWLLKLDGVSDHGALADSAGFGRTEYAYYLMAVAAGLDMTECRLLEEHDRAHFMTRRFDRDGDTRIHVSTLCAMAHMDFNQPRTHEYAQYLQTVDRLDLGPDARQQAFARAVFNIAAVNRDDHTKNLAFTLPQGGTWGLAPAYDVAHAYRQDSDWVAQHQMGVDGKFHNITTADILALADRFAVPAPGDVIDRVRAAVRRWPEFAADAAVPEETVALIAGHHDVLGLGD